MFEGISWGCSRRVMQMKGLQPLRCDSRSPKRGCVASSSSVVRRARSRPRRLAIANPAGAINGDLFRAQVEQHLLPTLKTGDSVARDPHSRPKVAGLRQAIEAVGAEVLYLPPIRPT